MKDRNVVSIEYQEPRGKWLRGFIIVSARSETGKIKSITLCVQDVTEEKRNQIEKEVAIQERVSFLGSIERIFHSMYLMDFKNNSLEMLNSGVESSSTVQPLRQVWNTWCDTDLNIEMLHEHQKFLNIDTLPDRLKRQGVLSDDLLSKSNGWLNFLIVPYKHDDDGNVVEALLLTRIIDELKKAELKQQEELRIANRAAEHDELTGIYNRYGFNKKLDELYKKPEKKTVAVIMMDLDYFKQVNDVRWLRIKRQLGFGQNLVDRVVCEIDAERIVLLLHQRFLIVVLHRRRCQRLRFLREQRELADCPVLLTAVAVFDD